MPSEVLKSVAQDIVKADESLKEAEELINALQEAGETTATQESELRKVKIRRDKWERMLKNRGVIS